jgi:hypothetical protein
MNTIKFEDVLQEDILYQDYDVCILKPDVKKGILIYSSINEESILTDGLKTGKQLKKDGIDFNRLMVHNYSFFRAPKFLHPIIRDSTQSEIESFFDSDFSSQLKVWIRIDPKQTFVYSSEIRATFAPNFAFGTPEYLNMLEQEVLKSRKPMIEYFKILQENSLVHANPMQKLCYNLFSSRVQMFPVTVDTKYPWNDYNINRNSEVLVRVNNLTPNFFVKC